MLRLPSGGYLTIRADFPGRARTKCGGRTEPLRCAAIERNGGRLGPDLRPERARVLLTDAVRDGGVVERLFFPEHRHTSLTLAPRTHDGHGRLPSLECSTVTIARANDRRQSGL